MSLVSFLDQVYLFYMWLPKYLFPMRLHQTWEECRAEMFEQIDKLKTELATLKQELDQWRDKYLNLHKEYTRLKTEFDKLKKDK